MGTKTVGATFTDEYRLLLAKREQVRQKFKKLAGRYDNTIGHQLAWQHTMESFRNRVEKLNEEITDYNRLRATNKQWLIPPLDAEHEIAHVR